MVAAGDVTYTEAPERALPPAPRAGIAPEPIERLVGREADLSELNRLLGQRRRVVVHGLGGVGKTQLVLAHLNRHRDDYPDGRFWLRGDQATTLIGDLASLAWRLGLPERETPEQELQIDAVLRWLREHPRWLLVIDNLDQPAAATMQDWLPPDLPGDLIITSRTPQGAARLRLRPLSQDVARDYLLERTGQGDAHAASTIAETLGGLPLALAQAAAYLMENPWRSMADYAELLQTRMAELLREGKPDGYPLPVASTWKLSFERIEQEQPAAADLLRLCAFLAPDDIPITVLQSCQEELPERIRDVLSDEIQCDQAIRALRSYSLLERQEDALAVHRLVQWVVRESLKLDEHDEWLAASVRLLNAAYPKDVKNPKQWAPCARLLPHALVAVGLIRDQPIEPTASAALLDRAGIYLQCRGEYTRARPVFERALAIAENALGPEHPGTATRLNNLAALLKTQGQLDKARPLFDRGLAIREKVLGPEHPDTANSLNNLAALLQAQGQLAAARPLFERALAIREMAMGPEHPDTASSLNNLAGLLQAQGELGAARPLFERALAIVEELLGPEHPDATSSLNNLASLLKAQGELAAARPLFERALASCEKVLGPEHPNTATSLNNLAGLLQAQGELAAARPLFERALGIRQKILGPEHPETASSLNNLAGLLQAEGDLAAARPLYERTVAIAEKVLGPEHPYTAFSLNNLAGLLQARGELAAARPLFERALAIFEKVLGPEHPNTATSLNNLAALLRAQGELAAARPLLERALAIREKVLGPEHPDTLASRRALGTLR